MEKIAVNECLKKLEAGISDLEAAKEDYNMLKEQLFANHGISDKVDQKNLEKIAKANVADKKDKYMEEINSAHDLLSITE